MGTVSDRRPQERTIILRNQHPATTTATARPKPWDLLLHIPRTFRLVGALMRDPRVAFIRKLFFFGSIGVLLVALLLPEALVATLFTGVLPLVGPLLNIPPDAGLDWLALGTASFALLRVFPSEIVSEHFTRIFHR